MNKKNNRDYTIKDIREDDRYGKVLVNNLLNNDYRDLANLDEKIRADRNFMEPLLFAIKKERNTFKVYKLCVGIIENDMELASEIIKEEPELIQGKKAGENKEFIKNHIRTNPNILKHVDSTLKADNNFIRDLIQNNKSNTNILNVVSEDPEILLNNPELCNNKEVMGEAILKNALFLKFASDNLKENYDFIKDVCTQNKEAIKYISENTDQFGEKGLTAAKEVLVVGTTTRAISEFDEKLKTAELGEIERRQLENNRKFIEKIKKGEVKPERAIRLINIICKNLGEEYREELMSYIKIDDAIVERYKESTEKANKNNTKYNSADIEKATERQKLEEIKIEEPGERQIKDNQKTR